MGLNLNGKPGALFFSSALPTRLTPLPGLHKRSGSTAPYPHQLFLHLTYPAHQGTVTMKLQGLSLQWQQGEAQHGQVA